MKVRVEFSYQKPNDETLILVWSGTRVIDKKIMPGVLSHYTKRKVRNEIVKEYENE